MSEKQCSTCKEMKALDQFYKHATNKDRLYSRCKSCHAAIGAEWATAHPESRRRSAQKWRKAHPELVREHKRKWNAEHAEQGRERSRRWAVVNAGRAKKNVRQWRVANPDAVKLNHQRRRARKAGNGVFIVNPQEIKRLFSRPCYLCNTAPSTTLDHIVPLAKGGRHAIGNLLGACRSCNSRKHDMFLFEFRCRRVALAA